MPNRETDPPNLFTFMLMIRILFSDQYTKDETMYKKLISKEISKVRIERVSN